MAGSWLAPAPTLIPSAKSPETRNGRGECSAHFHAGNKRRKLIMPGREELTSKILDEKRSRGLSWKEIAKAIGPGSPILYTAALLGQMTLTKPEAENAAKFLRLNDSDITLLAEPPNRGSLATVPPTDPLIYRFY